MPDETFEQFVDRMIEAGRMVSVWVEGDTTRRPRQGRATAMRVTNLLTEDMTTYFEYAPGDEIPALEHYDTALMTYEYGRDYDQFDTLTKQQAVARLNQLHVVVHADQLPPRALDRLDVHITTTETGGIDSVYRVLVQPTTYTTYEKEIAGFVESATDET